MLTVCSIRSNNEPGFGLLGAPPVSTATNGSSSLPPSSLTGSVTPESGIAAQVGGDLNTVATELSQQEMASFASAAAGVADHLNNEGKLVLPHQLENNHIGLPVAQ
jgi:hypothetical protein